MATGGAPLPATQGTKWACALQHTTRVPAEVQALCQHLVMQKWKRTSPCPWRVHRFMGKGDKLKTFKLMPDAIVTSTPPFTPSDGHIFQQRDCTSVFCTLKCTRLYIHIRVNQQNLPVWVYAVSDRLILSCAFVDKTVTAESRWLPTVAHEDEKKWQVSHHYRLGILRGAHKARNKGTLSVRNVFVRLGIKTIWLFYDLVFSKSHDYLLPVLFFPSFPTGTPKYQRSFELIESDNSAGGGMAIFPVSTTQLGKTDMNVFS